MAMNHKAHVYFILVAGELWYIGKGTGNRAEKHLRRARRFNRGLPMHRISPWQIELAGAMAAGATIEIQIVRDGLTDAAAYELEIELIAKLRPCKNKLAGGNGPLALDKASKPCYNAVTH